MAYKFSIGEDTNYRITNNAASVSLSVDGSLVITGDLTVQGTTATIDVNNLTVEDPLTILGSGNATDTLDLGFIGVRASDNVGIIWDESADEFAVILTADDGTTSGDITVASYANFQANNVVVNDLTVNGTATGIATALNDLTDVTITSPADGEALVYNAGTWVNQIVGLEFWEEALSTSAPNTGRNVVYWTTTSGTTNVHAALVPKGDGGVMADIPDGTATGGDARGQYSVDWQRGRSLASHIASGSYNAIGGGFQNRTSNSYSCIPGGRLNVASGTSSFAAGQSNTAGNSFAFCGGGSSNTASGPSSACLGGSNSTASGLGSVTLGGSFALATGNYAIAGGEDAHADADYAIALGREAKANHQGSVVICDSQLADETTTQVNEMRLRFANGVYINGNQVLNSSGVAGSLDALVDPNDDRIFFWDDSANQAEWLDLGAGLEITGTTISTVPTSLSVNAQTGTTYTIQASDNGGIVTLDNAAAITVSIPDGLPQGFTCDLIQLGAGTVSVSTSGTDTLNSQGSLTSLNGQYAKGTIDKYAATAWVLSGNRA